ncbi:MAG: efflux RND transporter periplasmic adaptor subunit [Alphaproteobacteria bacterium]|nr:efflux RND transporter periplasmic adaptor subunit [Alphaproteobacteria bacterium]
MFSTRNIFLVIVAALAILAIGYGVGRYAPSAGSSITAMTKTQPAAGKSEKKVLYYRDPMSAATSPKPGKDSMGMAFVPVYANASGETPDMVQLSPDRIQELGVQTAVVSRRDLARTVHAVGTVQIDETRQTLVSPRFGGWIEKMYVDATGMQVKKGDPLFVFYSPELAHIEAEYPFSHKTKNTPNGTIEKLQSLAVPEDEIARLEREHTVNDHITLRAPADGTVLQKMAIEGMRFVPGMTLYNLADLSDIWVMADVYEQDLARVAVGQNVKVTFTAYPGEAFDGKVDFVYPDINKQTRTAKVRIVLPNPNSDLRLDMYADANIMGEPEKNVLTVPASAVLNSGQRQVVLLALGDGRFRPQEVKTGMRAGDNIEILDGIKEGDRVVTSANFLIDSESNLRAALQGFGVAGKKQ